MQGALALVFLSGASGITAQTGSNPDRAVIEIIEVNNRNPVAIKMQIAPALDPRGSIGVVDNKLIIASTASNFAQLRDLITEADVPLRRLVVSVDFDHSSLVFTAAQQSQQAIEGDLVSFQPVVPTDTVATMTAPQIQVRTSIRANLAEVDVEVLNLPGFTGRHQLQLELGRWYVLNPPQDAIEEFEFDPALDGAQDILETITEPVEMPVPDAIASAPSAPTPPEVTTPPIAVRVDVLP